jgi:cysteine desulfuration protein SufE
MEFQSCLDKQRHFLEIFSSFSTQEEKYNHIIALGRASPDMSPEDQLKEHLVQGCQSLLYLKVNCQNNQLEISTHSDALISSGLAYLLTHVYNGESPEAVFKCPPTFLKDMGLINALSPSRANGLNSLYQKLQKESLKWLT